MLFHTHSTFFNENLGLEISENLAEGELLHASNKPVTLMSLIATCRSLLLTFFPCIKTANMSNKNILNFISKFFPLCPTEIKDSDK